MASPNKRRSNSQDRFTPPPPNIFSADRLPLQTAVGSPPTPSFLIAEMHGKESASRPSHRTPGTSASPKQDALSLSLASTLILNGSKTPTQSSIQSSMDRLALSDHDSLRLGREEMIQRALKYRSRGSVLARGTILKRDQFLQGLTSPQAFYLQGAPNFRVADLNVFGVSQPTETGVATILSLLKAKAHSNSSHDSATVHWFNTREEPIVYISGDPFVLRDAEAPMQNLRTYAGISSDRLEQMETRLKEDILNEAKKCDGLILVHDELDKEIIVPVWICADNVKTFRDIFQDFKEKLYQVTYTRIPISPEQRPEDKYLDEYVNTVRNASLGDALVFNCGMGVGRSTFGMVASLIIRRAHLIATGKPDPFPAVSAQDGMPGGHDLIDAESEKMAMLRMVYVLERGLNSKMSNLSAIEWALARSSLIDNIKNAILGNYNVILSLASVLDNGSRDKAVLDKIINRCDSMVNLREEILMNRVRHTVHEDQFFLEKALGSLERYFFLLSFCAYINETTPSSKSVPFSEWIMSRGEIWNMLESLRRRGNNLFLFRPVEDLSALSKNLGGTQTSVNELENAVIRNRNGTVLVAQTILKIDHWSSDLLSRSVIEGAPNFRHIADSNIFAVAQPTLSGMKNVLKAVSSIIGSSVKDFVWINLREEPIIYINGTPFVLRDHYYTLRNIKSYSGINETRLELLENRLKEDINKELIAYDGQILLHEESAGKVVMPSWVAAETGDIRTLKELVDHVRNQLHDIDLHSYRIPVTAEAAPEPSDFDHLMKLVGRYDYRKTAYILNCQIGLGRSTLGTVVVSLIISWLSGKKWNVPPGYREPAIHYQIIHSLLRVIRSGLESKRIVDLTIDLCSVHLNLRDCIEDFRLIAENEPDVEKASQDIRRGVQCLKRYFLIITFQAYLDQFTPDCLYEMESFESWLQKHAEFTTMLNELDNFNSSSLLPVGDLQPGEGVALTSEVVKVVSKRRGSVLAAQTILKYDHFPGCQKLSLPERLDGAPNFRGVNFYELDKSLSLPLQSPNRQSSFVYGVAMPTRDAIKIVLRHVGAARDCSKKLLWISLREEPVLYVNGKPYVLRMFQEPIKNLETTGIERERVELMESRMKDDVLNELSLYGGRLLLHEEETVSGGFAIVPTWEAVRVEDVQTPKEVFESIQKEGFHVEYSRIPITDEQAPIPSVFDLLIQKISKIDQYTDLMFNCQMGRGRTTTGMVIACVSEFVRNHGHDMHKLAPGMLQVVEEQKAESELGSDEQERQRYLQGEFKVILQLVGVLPFGKISKMLVDRSIDICSHIQDIRGAIYDFKLRLESLEIGTKRFESMFKIGANYLIRYFFLITFTNYLLERNAEALKNGVTALPQGAFPSFSDWLADRREINFIQDNVMDFN